MAEENQDPYGGTVAHPAVTEEGWYFCFVKGNDLGAVAERIQYFLEMDYVLHGNPFVLDGVMYQAMYLPAGVSAAQQRRVEQSQKEHPIEEYKPDRLPDMVMAWFLSLWDR